MHARGALVSMIVAAGLSLAGCAFIDDLKDTVSKMASQDGHGRERAVPDATGGIAPTITPREEAKLPTKTPEAKKASMEKDPPARKLQDPPTVKRPSSATTEPVTQEPAAQSPPSQSASSQLLTPWPKAPSSESFSR